MIVELHMLQNFVPSCLNRDDTNSPKECEFGGSRRARISSQCIKRSIREYFKQGELVPLENLATRTKDLVRELVKRLVETGKNEEESRKAVVKAIEATAKLKLKEKDKTEYLLFLGEKEIASFLNLVLNNWDVLNDAGQNTPGSVGKGILDILSGGKAVDLALFGRMLADLPTKNIDAACQVAHAISTHRVGVEFDFYTAVDDLQPEEDTGAGMMGTVEFNSACFYRYANIDTKQLETNLDADGALIRKTVAAFIRASVQAIPSGKKNSFAQQNLPSFVFAVVRDNGAWSLANAFSCPVRTGADRDLVKDSKDALIDYWERLNKIYGNKGIKEAAAYSLENYSLNGISDAASLDGLVDRVNLAVSNAREV